MRFAFRGQHAKVAWVREECGLGTHKRRINIAPPAVPPAEPSPPARSRKSKSKSQRCSALPRPASPLSPNIAQPTCVCLPVVYCVNRAFTTTPKSMSVQIFEFTTTLVQPDQGRYLAIHLEETVLLTEAASDSSFHHIALLA